MGLKNKNRQKKKGMQGVVRSYRMPSTQTILAVDAVSGDLRPTDLVPMTRDAVEKAYDARHQAWEHRVDKQGYTRVCNATGGDTSLATTKTPAKCFVPPRRQGGI